MKSKTKRITQQHAEQYVQYFEIKSFLPLLSENSRERGYSVNVDACMGIRGSNLCSHRLCLSNLDMLVKVQPHDSESQTNGLSPGKEKLERDLRKLSKN